MPWKTEDAHKHKEGLSQKQAEQWASVANSALKSCQDKEGKDCEATAIKSANSAVSKDKEVKMASAWVPHTVTSYDELEQIRKAQEEVESLKGEVSDFQQLVDNVVYSENTPDKPSSIIELSKAFGERVKGVFKGGGDTPPEDDETEDQDVVDMADEDEEKSVNNMMVFKDTDTGEYRWITRYSNNFRDRDVPPEIISKDSHIRFVEMVEKGEAELPELWLWHVPEWKIGQADWVAWDAVTDETGFALAGGHFDKEAYWLAKQLEGVVCGVSHGMPVEHIKRSAKDTTIIVEHITKEISPLPAEWAANEIADFMAISKESTMAIPKEKREKIIGDWGIEPDKLDDLEGRNRLSEAKAKENQVEFKEVSKDDESVQETSLEDDPKQEEDAEESPHDLQNEQIL